MVKYFKLYDIRCINPPNDLISFLNGLPNVIIIMPKFKID